MQASAVAFDPKELRRAFGSFVTGVTIVTALDAHGHPVGLTANSFSSVSMDPPLVLWSQSLTAPSHPVFKTAERFAINILADDQSGLSDRFARGGTDKFSGVPVRQGLGGVPLIDGAAALLECTRVGHLPGRRPRDLPGPGRTIRAPRPRAAGVRGRQLPVAGARARGVLSGAAPLTRSAGRPLARRVIRLPAHAAARRGP